MEKQNSTPVTIKDIAAYLEEFGYNATRKTRKKETTDNE